MDRPIIKKDHRYESKVGNWYKTKTDFRFVGPGFSWDASFFVHLDFYKDFKKFSQPVIERKKVIGHKIVQLHGIELWVNYLKIYPWFDNNAEGCLRKMLNLNVPRETVRGDSRNAQL